MTKTKLVKPSPPRSSPLRRPTKPTERRRKRGNGQSRQRVKPAASRGSNKIGKHNRKKTKEPSGSRERRIELGTAPGPNGVSRPVYGFFDANDRFRREMNGYLRTDDGGTRPATIGHQKVKYRQCFRHLESRQVREKAKHLLKPPLSGEI